MTPLLATILKSSTSSREAETFSLSQDTKRKSAPPEDLGKFNFVWRMQESAQITSAECLATLYAHFFKGRTLYLPLNLWAKRKKQDSMEQNLRG